MNRKITKKTSQLSKSSCHDLFNEFNFFLSFKS